MVELKYPLADENYGIKTWVCSRKFASLIIAECFFFQWTQGFDNEYASNENI
jgi:hypothetical protein